MEIDKTICHCDKGCEPHILRGPLETCYECSTCKMNVHPDKHKEHIEKYHDGIDPLWKIFGKPVEVKGIDWLKDIKFNFPSMKIPFPIAPHIKSTKPMSRRKYKFLRMWQVFKSLISGNGWPPKFEITFKEDTDSEIYNHLSKWRDEIN